LGGVIFAWMPALPFVCDAVSYAGSAVLLAHALSPGDSRHARWPTSLSADIRIGVRWLCDHRLLRLLAIVVSTFAFCQAAVLSVLVLYGLHVLHLTNAGYGLFLAVG